MASEHDSKIDQPLLDDTDFVALIEAEFDVQQTPSDALRKQRIWNNLDSHLDEPARKSKRFSSENPGITSFAVAAILMIVIIPALMLDRRFALTDTIQQHERNKGQTLSTPVSLSAYEYTVDGALLPFKGANKAGKTIVFKAETDHIATAALILSRNNASPEVRFIGDISNTASMQLLHNDNKVYGYMLEPDDNLLRFCIVQAKNKTLLQREIRMIDNWWTSLPSSSCVNITVIK